VPVVDSPNVVAATATPPAAATAEAAHQACRLLFLSTLAAVGYCLAIAAPEPAPGPSCEHFAARTFLPMLAPNAYRACHIYHFCMPAYTFVCLQRSARETWSCWRQHRQMKGAAAAAER
jgi:hypothetical protein